MLSGCCDDEANWDKMDQSITLARILILKQQNTGTYPYTGKYSVPRPFKTLVTPCDDTTCPMPYIPSLNHLPDVLPNIRLFTIELQDKFNIFQGGVFTANRCQQVLFEAEGIKLRMDRIFNCSTMGGDGEGHSFLQCTCHNAKIFKAVWLHPDMSALVRDVFRSYEELSLKGKAGVSYLAAFYCKTGNHRSVAAAIGFATMLNHMQEFKAVQIDVKHSNEIMHRRLCCGECCYCEKSIMREALELDLVRSAYKMAFP